jgi:hypothetical protein
MMLKMHQIKIISAAVFFMLVGMTSCNQNNNTVDANKGLSEHLKTPAINSILELGEMSSYKYAMSFYDMDFQMNTAPVINTINDAYGVRHVMLQANDTVFDKTLFVDSFLRLINKNLITRKPWRDSLKMSKLMHYRLNRATCTFGGRDGNSFNLAELISKDQDDTLYVSYGLRYMARGSKLKRNVGDLWVFGIDHRKTIFQFRHKGNQKYLVR